jgi:rRNA-processing protein FCF1
MKRKQIIVLDTSVLLSIFEDRAKLGALIDAAGGGELVVPSSVVLELKRIKGSSAAAALSLATSFPVFETEKRGGDGVIDAFTALNAFAVATNDSELADRIIRMGGRALRLNRNRRFTFYGTSDVP